MTIKKLMHIIYANAELTYNCDVHGKNIIKDVAIHSINFEKLQNQIFEELNKYKNKRINRQYIRFGEIPENEKSGVYNGDEGVIRFEKGVSVYDCIVQNGAYKIILPCVNIGALHTLETLAHYNNSNIYLVTGDYVGTGTDAEPLIKNVKIVGKLSIVETHDPKPINKMDRRDTQLILLIEEAKKY